MRRTDRQSDAASIPHRDGARADDAMASRLEELSLDEAERVIARAIELQSRSDHPAADVMDPATLQRIADELEIEPDHLQRALREEMTRVVPGDGVIDRFVVPASLAHRIVADGDVATVEDSVDQWMVHHEGLRKRSTAGTRTVWEKDSGLVASARMGLRVSHGSGRLRDPAGVTTEIRSLTTEAQLVSFDADTSNLRSAALGLLAAAGGATVDPLQQERADHAS